jgi:hypothetical protein
MDNSFQQIPDEYEAVQRSEFDKLVSETKQELEQAAQADLRAKYKQELDAHRGSALEQTYVKAKYREQGLDQKLDWTNSQVQAELERRIIEKARDLNRRTYEQVQKNIYNATQQNLLEGFNSEVKELRGLDQHARSLKYAELCAAYRQKGLKV